MYALNDQVVFDDPDFGPKHGRVSHVYSDGDLEVAVPLGARESRSLVYALSRDDKRLSPVTPIPVTGKAEED